MALWVDKYRPHELSKLTYHTEQANHLASIIKAGDFPHLLIYGPSGAGKKTLIHCILRELYGSGVERMSATMKTFEAASGKKLEIQTVSSNYHIQLSAGDVGIYDRVVVQNIIKQMAQAQQIDTAKQKPFKVVVLMEVEQLTRDAQHALRRTMEKYSATCRLILCCESIAKIIDPLRSRCMAIRVAAPSDHDAVVVVEAICKAESVAIPDPVVASVVKKACGNMRRILLMVEAIRVQSCMSEENQFLPEPDWEVYLKETARMILQQQSAENLLKVRSRIYECISRCIPPNVIFVNLLRELLHYCDGAIKAEVVACAAEYEHRLTRGTKAVFHLEAFVASFMDIYHRQLTENASNH
uniref:AAA+ ATPase domain-containing protein n=1 Tax=Parascaris univalens TaxID=6257 RepID=A0A914ZSP4_PARUN